MCALSEAVFGLCCKEIPEAFMCPGDCPKHYTRGDLKFQMSCDRPSHWTLLKGVNLTLETHSFSGVWRQIDDSLLSQRKITLSLQSHTERFKLPSVVGCLGCGWNLKRQHLGVSVYKKDKSHVELSNVVPSVESYEWKNPLQCGEIHTALHTVNKAGTGQECCYGSDTVQVVLVL